jgi:hypothetical protein
MTSATPDQGRAAYVNGVEALRAFDPAQRGSGTKTSVLAALVAWVFADRPEEGLVVSADYLGTDTDSIATMAGAVLGAAGVASSELPGTVQDQDYLSREADRVWAASAGLRPPRFPYPDVLSWRPPRSGMDGVAAEDDQLHLVGLGPGGALGEPYATEGKTPGVWQWMQLWFGQTVLAKRRDSQSGPSRPRRQGEGRTPSHPRARVGIVLRLISDTRIIAADMRNRLCGRSANVERCVPWMRSLTM